MSQPFDTQAFNKDVRNWGRGSLQQLRTQLSTLGVRQTGRLLAELNVRFRSRYGRVGSIAFAFPRYAVFVEKGAGRGYGGQKGSRWRTGGSARRTNPESLGRMGTGNRQAKPWYNPVMDREVPELADLVLKHYMDASINSIRIR